MSTLKQFELDLSAFSVAIELDISIVLKKTALDLFKKIVKRTPVDKGRARASWIMSQEIPNTTDVAPKLEKGEKYTLAQALANGKLGEVYPNSIIFITNNLEYIEALETGHSQQAPKGMVRMSLIELEAELQQIIGG